MAAATAAPAPQTPAGRAAPAPDLTIRVRYVLDYQDTAEIRRYLAVMAAIGLVPAPARPATTEYSGPSSRTGRPA